MRQFASFAAVGGIALGLGLLLSPSTAESHESREIAGGQYTLVVGFLDEPAFAGEKNGLDLRISGLSSATPGPGEELDGPPVEGLEETLQAEVIFGDQIMALPIAAVFDSPGAYESVFFPMQPGDYTFRIYGTIGEVAVDESFTSGPETFGSVQDPEPLQFPR